MIFGIDIHVGSYILQLKLVNRLATIQNDGTVQFEVPEDIKPHTAHLDSGVISGEPGNAELIDAGVLPDLPPLQIVMLIVGTRGDVQPFVAIGKRLQVNMLSKQSFFRKEFAFVNMCYYHTITLLEL